MCIRDRLRQGTSYTVCKLSGEIELLIVSEGLEKSQVLIMRIKSKKTEAGIRIKRILFMENPLF